MADSPTVRITSPSLQDWYRRLFNETVLPVKFNTPRPTKVGGVPLQVYWLDLRRIPSAARLRLDVEMARRWEVSVTEAHVAIDMDGLPILAASAVVV